jgi:hypothetical protein
MIEDHLVPDDEGAEAGDNLDWVGAADPVRHADSESPAVATDDVRSRLQHDSRLDRIYDRLLFEARSTFRPLRHSSQLDAPEEWERLVVSGYANFRSGKALMKVLGADALIDAETAGTLLAMRVDLIGGQRPPRRWTTCTSTWR